MSVSTGGGLPQFNPEDHSKIAKKLKKKMDLVKSSKDFTADVENKKGIKDKYFGSEPSTESSDKKIGEIDKFDMPLPPTRKVVPPQISKIQSHRIIEDYGSTSPQEVKTHEKTPEVAGEVLRTKKSVQMKQEHKPHVDANELASNPLMMKMKKKAEDADTNALGYTYNAEFEMYIHPKKDPLTKDEMKSLLQKEVKVEGHSKELDAYAKKDGFSFDRDSLVYISKNGDSLTTAEMKEKMEVENKALAKGYKPIKGMEGLFEKGNDIQPADYFR